MTVLIVIGVLILLSVLLVNVPVAAHIKFYGGRLEFAVKYLGIGILKFPREKKKRLRKKRKRSRLPSSKTSPSEEDEEIFEDIAEIGFSGGSNDAAEPESGFDDDPQEGENEQENEFTEGERSTENSEKKTAEISMDNLDEFEENSEEILTENPDEFEENSEEILTENPEEFEENSEEILTENPEDNSEKIKKNSKEKSSEKKQGKNSSKKKSRGSSDDESNDDESEKPLGERISELVEKIERKKDAALLLWELCEGHLIKLLRKISVDGLAVDFAAADEDAAKAALAYGKLCAGFYNFLGVIMGLTKVKVKSVSIDCLYDTPSEKSRFDGEFKVKLRPASLLNALNAILFDYVRGRKKYRPALNEFIGGAAAMVQPSVTAVKRYRAAKSKNSTN